MFMNSNTNPFLQHLPNIYTYSSHPTSVSVSTIISKP